MELSILDHIYLDTDHPFIVRSFDITNCQIDSDLYRIKI